LIISKKEVGVLCFEILEIVKRDTFVEEDAAKHFGKLEFWVSTVEGRGTRKEKL
jgi:hypothetical protein